MGIDIAQDLKAQVKAGIASRRRKLVELSLKIHSHPELGFKELKASAWLTAELEKSGFTIERGICRLPTAFKASYGSSPPLIAILAEYDALPNLGHSCGHNIIATSAIGAAIACRPAVDRFGGTVLVIGTPAEELHGGKILMAERAAFEGLDIAMMVHPSTHDTATTRTLACAPLEVEFFGREAHAAAHPYAGINALEAMILSFTAINSLRQHIRDKARIHGIITDGGQAANVVPGHSAGSFLVRAEDEAYLEELKQKVLNCFIGAATASGARLEHRWGKLQYAPMNNNLVMAQLFMENMRSLGRNTKLSNPKQSFGSTDMGNVSQLVPSIHPSVAIAPTGTTIHSPEFAEVAASAAGSQGMLDAATAMALTVVDLLANPELVAAARKEFTDSL